jgi:hypothetical protein
MIDRTPKSAELDVHTVGQQVFDRRIQPNIAEFDPSEFVAIDTLSEDYEIDRNSLVATKRLLARRPGARIWMRRVGRPYTYRLGTPRAKAKVHLRRANP